MLGNATLGLTGLRASHVTGGAIDWFCAQSPYQSLATYVFVSSSGLGFQQPAISAPKTYLLPFYVYTFHKQTYLSVFRKKGMFSREASDLQGRVHKVRLMDWVPGLPSA